MRRRSAYSWRRQFESSVSARQPTDCSAGFEITRLTLFGMTDREQYTPGPASGAHIQKDGEKWTLILVRELRHSPEKVWQALTDPAHLREWAPFDSDGSLATPGTTVKLTTVRAPTEQVSETKVIRADAPKLLEYNWGPMDLRWELEPLGAGTRLTLWHNIDRR